MNFSHLQSTIDFASFSKEKFQDVIDKAIDWALMHGLTMKSKQNFSKGKVQIAPFTLVPSSFPKKSFKKVKNIQILLNELMHNVAHDHDFLKSTLKSTIEVDEFTSKLYSIYNTIRTEGSSQSISLGLLRSDYLLHNGPDEEIKQIELNTIASSFGGLATVVSEYHRFILNELGHADKLDCIPQNNALTGLCNGLVEAWTLYDKKEAVILFIVEDVTYNICDQRFHEFEIRKLNSSIKIIRRSLRSLGSLAYLGPNKELIVDNLVVAVVYFRSGYELEAYPTEQEWSVRLLLERSQAIKCPSIQYHLAGTKKIQQALAQPGVLNKFVKDSDSVAKIQEVFTGLYSLDSSDEGDKIIEMGIQKPKNYVLKPQREGGGNNVYDENVRIYLTSMKDSKERSAWILMDRINPPLQKNYLLRFDNLDSNEDLMSEVVSELGIYGVIIGEPNGIIINEEVGHVLRTKVATENEGGIIAGVGALDTPYLVD